MITQEERLKRIGAKKMDQVLDEQIGVHGSERRVEYEKELKRELIARLTKLENRNWFERLFNIDIR